MTTEIRIRVTQSKIVLRDGDFVKHRNGNRVCIIINTLKESATIMDLLTVESFKAGSKVTYTLDAIYRDFDIIPQVTINIP